MYICLCNPFSDRDVQDYLKENPDCPATAGKVYRACSGGQSPQCCTCLQTLKDMLSEHKTAQAA